MKNNLQETVRILHEGNSFLIAGHVNADGDSIGSTCALGISLRTLGKTVLMVSPDGVPEAYRFLPCSDQIVSKVSPDQSFDAALIVDCESLSRLGHLQPVLNQAGKVIEIDHHPGGERGGNIQVVDPSAAATAEIVFEILGEAGVVVNQQIAECLQTGMITDTGCFRFSNVKPSSLRIAATLLEAGASISKIVRSVYETRSLTHAKLLGAALSSLKMSANGRVVYSTISQEQFHAARGNGTESEGIVNYVRSIRGAQVGILFREEEDGLTKVSLRSSEDLDISQVARRFGGGGHKMAAGCTIERPLPEAVDLVMDAVQKWMAS